MKPPIQGKAPVSYADWHKLYHEHTKGLGFTTMSYYRWVLMLPKPPSAFDFIKGPAFRRLIYRVRQIQRIESQMQAAAERNDITHWQHTEYVTRLLDKREL